MFKKSNMTKQLLIFLENLFKIQVFSLQFFWLPGIFSKKYQISAFFIIFWKTHKMFIVEYGKWFWCICTFKGGEGKKKLFNFKIIPYRFF